MWRLIDSVIPGQDIVVGVWVDGEWSQWVVAWDPNDPHEYGNDGTYGDPPTHWMPMPVPPIPHRVAFHKYGKYTVRAMGHTEDEARSMLTFQDHSTGWEYVKSKWEGEYWLIELNKKLPKSACFSID